MICSRQHVECADMHALTVKAECTLASVRPQLVPALAFHIDGTS